MDTLLCPSGRSARQLRQSLGLNQQAFWNKIGITQSGGSRYESGRDMPIQVVWLLDIAYGTEDQAQARVAALREIVKE
ncbi:DNA-binding transcriptional regulator [Azonexus sp.]|uniref:helix-turn-helix domain-containing protein n=1 Tax=Azonexus sp. TaxID=1872668 RepID=UPI0027B92FA1|nr:helix-turn-helix transcriptional regulator [Azonexus sp.]